MLDQIAKTVAWSFVQDFLLKFRIVRSLLAMMIALGRVALAIPLLLNGRTFPKKLKFGFHTLKYGASLHQLLRCPYLCM